MSAAGPGGTPASRARSQQVARLAVQMAQAQVLEAARAALADGAPSAEIEAELRRTHEQCTAIINGASGDGA